MSVANDEARCAFVSGHAGGDDLRDDLWMLIIYDSVAQCDYGGRSVRRVPVAVCDPALEGDYRLLGRFLTDADLRVFEPQFRRPPRRLGGGVFL